MSTIKTHKSLLNILQEKSKNANPYLKNIKNHTPSCIQAIQKSMPTYNALLHIEENIGDEAFLHLLQKAPELCLTWFQSSDKYQDNIPSNTISSALGTALVLNIFPYSPRHKNLHSFIEKFISKGAHPEPLCQVLDCKEKIVLGKNQSIADCGIYSAAKGICHFFEEPDQQNFLKNLKASGEDITRWKLSDDYVFLAHLMARTAKQDLHCALPKEILAIDATLLSQTAQKSLQTTIVEMRKDIYNNAIHHDKTPHFKVKKI